MPTVYWVSGIAAALIALVLLLSRRRKPEPAAGRRHQKASTPIVEAVDGEIVQISGRIRLTQTIKAALSERECAFFRVRVEEIAKAPTEKEEHAAEFLLEDDGGRARVILDRYKLVLTYDKKATCAPAQPASAALQRVMYRLFGAEDGNTANRSITLREGCLTDGMQVCVRGIGHWEKDTDPGSRLGADHGSAPQRLRIEAPQDSQLMIADGTDLRDRLVVGDRIG